MTRLNLLSNHSAQFCFAFHLDILNSSLCCINAQPARNDDDDELSQKTISIESECDSNNERNVADIRNNKFETALKRVQLFGCVKKLSLTEIEFNGHRTRANYTANTKTGKIQIPLKTALPVCKENLTIATIRPASSVFFKREEKKIKTINRVQTLSSYGSVVYNRLMDNVSEKGKTPPDIDIMRERMVKNEKDINVLMEVIKNSYAVTNSRLNTNTRQHVVSKECQRSERTDSTESKKNIEVAESKLYGYSNKSSSSNASFSVSIGEVYSNESSSSPGEIFCTLMSPDCTSTSSTINASDNTMVRSSNSNKSPE